MNGVAVRIIASASHEAHAFGDDLSLDEALLYAELGDETAVLRDDDIARVVGDAVVPHLKNETGIGNGFEVERVAIVVDAAVGDGSSVFGLNGGRDVIIDEAEIGGEGAILCDDDGARVVSDAVIPVKELAAKVGNGFDDGSVAIIEGAAARHGAPSGGGLPW